MLTDVQGFSSRFRRVFAVGFAAALSLCAPQLPAATIIVTGTQDGPLASGCTLRAAIVNAETDSKAGSIACARGDAGPDTIILPPEKLSITSSATGEESSAAQGDLDITTDITILGGGQQFSIIDADSTGRIFDIHASGNLTLSRVLLFKGLAGDLTGGQPDGGAVRVLGTLTGDDIGVQFSTTSSLVANGRGGGIYAAPGAVVSLNRSALHWNKSLGLNGSGGAIYCNSCQLDISTTSFGENEAQVAAAVYVESGSAAALDYVSIGFNKAPAYAGLYNAGALQLFATNIADNGAALSGDDLFCAGGTFAAEYSFAEFPQGCTPTTGLRSRADLPANFEPQLLRELTHNRFSGQPSLALPWERGVFDTVPAAHARCIGHLDQLGTPGVNAPLSGPASSDPGCASGSYEAPLAVISPMISGALANGANVSFDIGVLATVTVDSEMHFRTRGAGGIAETCDFKDPLTGLPPAPVAIPAGAGGLTLSFDPDWVFHTPSLDRHRRVCEIEGVIVSAQPEINGATTGVIRVVFDDGLLGAGVGFSSPAPGNYLQFGTVPYGDYVPFATDGRDGGGDASIFFFAGVDPVHITGATVSDPARFQVNNEPTLAAPLVVPVAPASAVALSIRCKGGVFGDFDGVLTVSAVRNPASATPEPLVLVYGLRCRVAHLLTVSASPYFGEIGEGDGIDLELIGRLDSPNATGAPITFDYVYDGGTATQGADFSFLSPLSIVIPDGAGQANDFLIQVYDDLVFSEPDETLLMHVVLPVRNDVELSGGIDKSMHIVDNDVPVDGAAVTLTGMPTHMQPAATVEAQIVAENTSSVAMLSNVHVVSNVDAPSRLLSYLVTEVVVTCEAYTDYLIVKFKDDPLAMPSPGCATGDLLSSLPQVAQPVANELALRLVAGSLCEISGNGREGDCSLNRGVPAGTRILVRAVVLVADMADAPQLDFPGRMVVRLAAMGDRGPVLAMDEADYVIDGDEKAREGALGWPFLIVLGLLALRGRRERSAGRKIG